MDPKSCHRSPGLLPPSLHVNVPTYLHAYRTEGVTAEPPLVVQGPPGANDPRRTVVTGCFEEPFLVRLFRRHCSLYAPGLRDASGQSWLLQYLGSWETERN
jgi:hypothetical protein